MSQLFSDSARHRRIGIALVTVTTLMFALLDASAKWLVVTLPVMQVRPGICATNKMAWPMSSA